MTSGVVVGSMEYRGNVAFREYCDDLFSTLYRADQRRAGEGYLHGLLNCPGRKSVRRLAAALADRSEQSLQQFINHSPWNPEPLRRRLLSMASDLLRPTAWVLQEVAFPKHGRYSAAVERQYVRSMGKVSNCQLAVAVTLTDERHSVPVNWRLTVPESWGIDPHRRSRARMPEHELPRPYWQYQIEMLDDMALEWGVPNIPVVVDARHRGIVEALLSALELRRQPYLAQVSPGLSVCCGRELAGGRVMPGRVSGQDQWVGPVGELIQRVGGLRRETVQWRDAEHGRTLRSQFLRLPLRGGRGPGPSDRRLLLCDWPLGQPSPRGVWLTDLVERPLAELVSLAKLADQATVRMEHFSSRYGLRDYEGRTFAGWHHHVTLSTAAYVYDLLGSVQAGSLQTGMAPEVVAQRRSA